jgi:NADPH:quinone reductase-like Zn-dependent oxidoreductase
MRAISQERFGGPEVLHLVEVDQPQPIPTEVLVRVRAIGLNPIEAAIRSGARPSSATHRSSSAGISRVSSKRWSSV